MTPDEARYYTSQSVESDPADLRELLDALPEDPRPLLDVVAGLILDTTFVAPLGVVCPPESADDVEIRRLPEMLGRILARGPGSLATARPPGEATSESLSIPATSRAIALSPRGVRGATHAPLG